MLSAMKGASVRYVSRSSELGRPDMIILPAQKNTMGDLLWMRQNGLEALILKRPRREHRSGESAADTR